MSLPTHVEHLLRLKDVVVKHILVPHLGMWDMAKLAQTCSVMRLVCMCNAEYRTIVDKRLDPSWTYSMYTLKELLCIEAAKRGFMKPLGYFLPHVGPDACYRLFRIAGKRKNAPLASLIGDHVNRKRHEFDEKMLASPGTSFLNNLLVKGTEKWNPRVERELWIRCASTGLFEFHIAAHEQGDPVFLEEMRKLFSEKTFLSTILNDTDYYVMSRLMVLEKWDVLNEYVLGLRSYTGDVYARNASFVTFDETVWPLRLTDKAVCTEVADSVCLQLLKMAIASGSPVAMKRYHDTIDVTNPHEGSAAYSDILKHATIHLTVAALDFIGTLFVGGTANDLLWEDLCVYYYDVMSKTNMENFIPAGMTRGMSKDKLNERRAHDYTTVSKELVLRAQLSFMAREAKNPKAIPLGCETCTQHDNFSGFFIKRDPKLPHFMEGTGHVRYMTRELFLREEAIKAQPSTRTVWYQNGRLVENRHGRVEYVELNDSEEEEVNRSSKKRERDDEEEKGE